MTPIIEVKGLSKKYQIGEQQPYLTLRDTLAGLLKNPFKKIKDGLKKDEFWALKDINFTVEPGEVVGIIGRNGAGKSTLLKILSRITPPTTGEITLRGRVGSLLEVGTGFQQELTGRENIYLNGAILGMSQVEIKRKFDEIVAFAEVEKFIDTPVKHYSSGMYMRLAFSIAAHLDPEILIVDEVLAVGDAEFQKKCLGKMDELSTKGKTILLVTHNLNYVSNYCTRAIFLHHGKCKKNTNVATVIKEYFNTNESSIKSTRSSIIKRVWSSKNNNKTDLFKFSENITLNFEAVFNKIYSKDVFCGIIIKDANYRVISTNEIQVNKLILNNKNINSRSFFSVTIPGKIMVPGDYSIDFVVHRPNREYIEQLENLVTYHVIADSPENIMYGNKNRGSIQLECEWSNIQFRK